MVYHIMEMDKKVADVCLSDDRTQISLIKFVPDGIGQPFSGDFFDLFRFYRFLKDRCYEDGRADLGEILHQANLSSNNPYEWVKITHGVTYEDFFWIKFDDEIIEWKDVRVR